MAAWAVSDLGHANDNYKPCRTCQSETFLFIQFFHQKNISRARIILRFFKKGPWGPFEVSEAFDYEIKIYSALKVALVKFQSDIGKDVAGFPRGKLSQCHFRALSGRKYLKMS